MNYYMVGLRELMKHHWDSKCMDQSKKDHMLTEFQNYSRTDEFEEILCDMKTKNDP